jgi:hypothetical protein
MISLSRIVLFFLLLLTASGVTAQKSPADFNDIYGSDPLLYNGRFYTFYPPLSTTGNQYLFELQFESGSVILRGTSYPDLLLNYDVYNQQLILKYKINTGAIYHIIVSDAWLESFSFRGMNFKLISTQDTTKKIFQVLGSGPKYIFYFWKKELNLDSFIGTINHGFSAAKKEKNLFDKNKILKYRNNKSFCSLFEPEKKDAVKEFLRKHSINVKKASDQSMVQLINYCNTL